MTRETFDPDARDLLIHRVRIGELEAERQGIGPLAMAQSVGKK
jgi:hypothetical protein